jgi:hypothetical protein
VKDQKLTINDEATGVHCSGGGGCHGNEWDEMENKKIQTASVCLVDPQGRKEISNHREDDMKGRCFHAVARD